MKRLIAIVEDEAAIRDNYAAAFAREGYAVRTYANRTQAMSAFAARLPDLAVIDISLEDEPEGGFELCWHSPLDTANSSNHIAAWARRWECH